MESTLPADDDPARHAGHVNVLADKAIWPDLADGARASGRGGARGGESPPQPTTAGPRRLIGYCSFRHPPCASASPGDDSRVQSSSGPRCLRSVRPPDSTCTMIGKGHATPEAAAQRDRITTDLTRRNHPVNPGPESDHLGYSKHDGMMLPVAMGGIAERDADAHTWLPVKDAVFPLTMLAILRKRLKHRDGPYGAGLGQHHWVAQVAS